MAQASEDNRPQTELQGITMRTVLEHPVLAPRLDALYEKGRAQNPSLPPTLEKFISETFEGTEEKSFLSNGRVKWQAALTYGLQEARAKAWEKKAQKRNRERVKEMAGEWILKEPPWWTRFQRPTWQIAMRLRYGLKVTPAIGKCLASRCLAKKLDGTYCLELLDEHGQHAQICKCEGASIHRHDTVSAWQNAHSRSGPSVR